MRSIHSEACQLPGVGVFWLVFEDRRVLFVSVMQASNVDFLFFKQT